MAKALCSLNILYHITDILLLWQQRSLWSKIIALVYIYNNMALGVIASFCHIKLDWFSPKLQECSKGPAGLGHFRGPQPSAHSEPGHSSSRRACSQAQPSLAQTVGTRACVRSSIYASRLHKWRCPPRTIPSPLPPVYKVRKVGDHWTISLVGNLVISRCLRLSFPQTVTPGKESWNPNVLKDVKLPISEHAALSRLFPNE